MATLLHAMDGDLASYLEYNTDLYTAEDVIGQVATIAGHNDEDHWFWVVKLRDGQYAMTTAWCDYTGWDCQSGGSSELAPTAEAAANLAPLASYGRDIRRQLLGQIQGTVPYGLETRPPQ